MVKKFFSSAKEGVSASWGMGLPHSKNSLSLLMVLKDSIEGYMG
jgi:hypothetical protein